MNVYSVEAGHYWNKARRQALWSTMFQGQRLKQEPLLSFDKVAHRLKLKHAVYRGIHRIPIDSIVGSVGRYQDFTSTFLPTNKSMEQRWKNVAAAYLDSSRGGVPPIELFKVGVAYFVKDGNHRVSVARQLKIPDIEAYVWEYPEPVAGLGDEANIDSMLIEAEKQDFFDQTQLDKLRPDSQIEVTVPGGYTDLLCQIAHYREALSQIDDTDVSYEEAVTAWHDMVFETAMMKMRKKGVLDLFPNRTEADFFVWIMRHHQRLKEEYQRPVMLSQTVQQFRERNKPSILGRLRRLWRRLRGFPTNEPL